LNGKAIEVKHRWIWLAAVTAVGFIIDIGTKHLAATRLTEGMPVNVAGEYLQWLLVYNKGAVFGTNPAGLIPWLKPNVFLSIFMLCSIAFLLCYYYALKRNEVLMHIGLMLVLPGAFGNLYDRAVHGKEGVVDFIRMGFPPDNYWFIYNVADIFVTAGVAVMLFNFALEALGKKPPGETAMLDSIKKEADKEADELHS
jgi:signal peptidase II